MEILNWPIEAKIKQEIDNHYRTKLALSLKDEEPWKIISCLTFDSVAPKLKQEEVKDLFVWVNQKILAGGLQGVGLELGSGVGFMSAILASLPLVRKVYAVEIVENIVRELSPKIVRFVLVDKEAKVVSCVGEFDHLGLEENSINFVFDFFSLHHSVDLVKTLSETFRVLKPGGFIFCFDKARSDKLTLSELDLLLDKEYDEKTKTMMGLPSEITHSRRQNGEHEYRLSDWREAFGKAGFVEVKNYHLARIAGNRVSCFLKFILSWLPIAWQIKLTDIFYRHKTYNNLELSNLVFSPSLKNFPKEISLLIAYKK